jgi:inorganic pyrophosphatase
MTMIDGGESDDKMIAVPASDPRFDGVTSLKDVNPYTLKEMRHFFETYKTIDGKKVEIKGFHEREEAEAAIARSQALYQEKFPKQQ